ncbi:MAG: hypothetical protein AAFW00_07200 [Bacteroidota bacterium]
MKQVLFTILSLLITFSGVHGQRLIAVQNGGAPTFYTNLDSAIQDAQAGDTVYIPGYFHNVDTFFIEKPLILVGVGHDPDSTLAYGINTEISAITVLKSDSVTLIGMLFDSPIYLGTNTQAIQKIKIQSCRTEAINYGNSATQEVVIINSVIKNLVGLGNENCRVFNSIIDNGAQNFSNGTVFQNNFFLQTSLYYLNSMNNCTFSNNVILNIQTGINNQGNVFFNNLKFGSFTGISSDNVFYNNEIFGGTFSVVKDTIFADIGNGQLFAYDRDYNLISSLGKNGGSDGTDIGIYGGPFPWKDGSIPFHPHIQQKVISPVTDSLGRLPIQIRVRAQNY